MRVCPARHLPLALVVAISLPCTAHAQDNATTPRITLDVMVVERAAGNSRTVVVQSVTPRGVGYRMGMVAGDTILAINGKAVDSIAKLHELLANAEALIVFEGSNGTFYRGYAGIPGGSSYPESPEPPKEEPRAEPARNNPPPQIDVNGFAKSEKALSADAAIKWSQLPELNIGPVPAPRKD